MRQENKTETRPGEQNLKFGVKEGTPHIPLTMKKGKKEMPRFSKNEFTQRNVDAGDARNGKEKIENINYIWNFIFEKLSIAHFNYCEILWK